MSLFQRKTDRAVRGLLLAALAGGTLGGCSDIYYDRRDTISLASGDAINRNKVVHMIDPWPAHSVDRNIAFNGERLQGAAERYRTHRVVQPVPPTTSEQEQPSPPPALTTEQIPGKAREAMSPATTPSVK